MASTPVDIDRAFWLGPGSGCVLLTANCGGSSPPALALEAKQLRVTDVRRAAREFVGQFFGYYERADGWIVFCQEAERHPQIDFKRNPVRVAGPFNDWGRSGRMEDWQLAPRAIGDGLSLWECAVPRERLHCGPEGTTFKFVSADWSWLTLLHCAPNLVTDEACNLNHHFDPRRTGAHVFCFRVTGGRALTGQHRLRLTTARAAGVPVRPGLSYYRLVSQYRLGAIIERKRSAFPFFNQRESTIFRLFAPRARAASVEFFAGLATLKPRTCPLQLLEDGLTWEVRVPGNLHGWYYTFRVDGENDGVTTHFNAAQPIVDPWALAVVSSTGPGIVIDREKLPGTAPAAAFTPPRREDLVIVEAHVRDLIELAPIPLTGEERLGFRGLMRWLATDGSYLRQLGANALELLPIQQSDARDRREYHWGYMTTNYFSPCAYYAGAPECASAIAEFRELVAECHRHQLAVILDVVYNHVGEPAFLLFLDKAIYFQLEPDGSLANWSGCGNTLKAESAMVQRLIRDSLLHLVKTFDVDGFRFDLGQLLTVEALHALELTLREVKPSIIVIAEPWSFRGHIAWGLRPTRISFWNDGYREFMADYVLGRGNAEGLRYFMHGSLDHLAAWPAQSVNYVASHDDRCWLDRITENPGHDGRNPTANDIHRTHLVSAILFCSIGIPMFAAGQDFLHSKDGMSNTYQRGDLNALDYGRCRHFGRTHEYYRSLIAFRLSSWGELVRLVERPGPGYVRLHADHDRSSAAILFNADASRGPRQLLFAINPHEHAVIIPVPDLRRDGWLGIADRENVNPHGIFDDRFDSAGQFVRLGPLDCGIWVHSG